AQILLGERRRDLAREVLARDDEVLGADRLTLAELVRVHLEMGAEILVGEGRAKRRLELGGRFEGDPGAFPLLVLALVLFPKLRIRHDHRREHVLLELRHGESIAERLLEGDGRQPGQGADLLAPVATVEDLVRAQGLEELVPADLRLHPRVVGLLGGGVLLRDDLRRAQASPELSAQLRELLIARSEERRVGKECESSKATY